MKGRNTVKPIVRKNVSVTLFPLLSDETKVFQAMSSIKCIKFPLCIIFRHSFVTDGVITILFITCFSANNHMLNKRKSLKGYRSVYVRICLFNIT